MEVYTGQSPDFVQCLTMRNGCELGVNRVCKEGEREKRDRLEGEMGEEGRAG